MSDDFVDTSQTRSHIFRSSSLPIVRADPRYDHHAHNLLSAPLSLLRAPPIHLPALLLPSYQHRG